MKRSFSALWERLRARAARSPADKPLPPPPPLRHIDAVLADLSSPTPRARWEAAAALAGATTDARAAQALVGCLDDPHPFVRMEVGKALAAFAPEVTRPLLAGALQSASARQAAAAAEALGRSGDEQAADVLAGALKHPEAAVRLSALEALAAVGSLTAITALLAALDDAEPSVRMVAVTLLGQLRPEAAARPMAERLAASVCQPNEECIVPTALRRQLTWAVGHLESGGDAVLRALVRALDDVDAGVRQLAAQGLGRVGDEAAVSALSAHLSDAGQGGTGRVGEAATAAIAAIQARARRKAAAKTAPATGGQAKPS